MVLGLTLTRGPAPDGLTVRAGQSCYDQRRTNCNECGRKRVSGRCILIVAAGNNVCGCRVTCVADVLVTFAVSCKVHWYTVWLCVYTHDIFLQFPRHSLLTVGDKTFSFITLLLRSSATGVRPWVGTEVWQPVLLPRSVRKIDPPLPTWTGLLSCPPE